MQIVAIVNDGSASLLAQAYIDKSTRLAVILGTGLNAAIYVPTSSFSRSKFGSRNLEVSVDAGPSHVVTNVELSMFGKEIFPTSRWDEELNQYHAIPNCMSVSFYNKEQKIQSPKHVPSLANSNVKTNHSSIWSPAVI